MTVVNSLVFQDYLPPYKRSSKKNLKSRRIKELKNFKINRLTAIGSTFLKGYYVFWFVSYRFYQLTWFQIQIEAENLL